jgi:threonine/homoserine/homoserine lactone efflux protein
VPLDAGTAAAFLGAATLLALAPGPDNLFVLAQAALHGARAGWLVTLGLCTGLLVHTAAVVLGVAAVLAANPAAFRAVKVVGAAYLLWLAVGAWRAGRDATPAAPRLSAGRLYGRGIVMNVSNPKVTLFFLALLPQFADAERGPVAPQLLALGALFLLDTLLVFGAIALLAGRLTRVLRQRPGAIAWLHRAAAVLFAALAARLLL